MVAGYQPFRSNTTVMTEPFGPVGSSPVQRIASLTFGILNRET
jgi:hypothetical protein